MGNLLIINRLPYWAQILKQEKAYYSDEKAF